MTTENIDIKIADGGTGRIVVRNLADIGNEALKSADKVDRLNQQLAQLKAASGGAASATTANGQAARNSSRNYDDLIQQLNRTNMLLRNGASLQEASRRAIMEANGATAAQAATVARVNREIKEYTNETKALSREQAALARQQQAANREIESGGKSARESTGLFKALAIAYVAIASVTGLARISDDFTKYNAQLKLATRSQQEFNQAQKDVKAIATGAQQDISATGTLYARLNNSLRDIGVNQAGVARTTETVALALKVSGATATESASAILQLSQAFGSGVLRGEEFNAVNEAAPALMRALADSIGVPVGALREMASEGKLTSDVLFKAFGDQTLLDKYREQAKEINTISGAWTLLRNEFLLTIGEFGKETGVVDLLAASMSGLATAIAKVRSAFPKGKILDADGQAALDRQNLEFLSKPGALGVREGTRKAQLAALQKKLGYNVGNQLPGGAAVGYTGAVSPNFGNTNVVDVDKLHKKQEEELRKQEQLKRKVQQDVKKEYASEDSKQQIKELQNVIDIEQDLYEQLGVQKEKLSEKEYKDRLEAIQDLFAAEDEGQRLLNETKYKDELALQAKREKLVEDAIDKQIKEDERRAEALEKSLTDALLRGFEAGKGFGENLKDTLYNMFRSLVLQPTISAVLSPITQALTGSGGGAQTAGEKAAAGMGGNLSGLVGGGKSIITAITEGFGKANNAYFTSIAKLGSTLSSLGLDKLGNFITVNSQLIGKIAPYAGAVMALLKGDVKGAILQGVGVAIGSYFGPVGGAIGGMIGSYVSSLFGGHVKRPKYYADETISSSGVTLNSLSKKDGKSATLKQFGTQAVGVGEQLRSYTEAFGGEIVKAFQLSMTYNQKHNLYGINVGRGSTKGEWDIYGKNGDITNAVADSFLLAVKKGFISLPEYLNNIVKRSSAGGQAAINTLGEIKNLYESLDTLPPVFKAIKVTIEEITVTTQASLDELKARITAFSTYVDLFYSDEEKTATLKKQLDKQYADLGLTLPATRDAYRALVEAQDATTISGYGTVNALIDLAPYMDQYYKALAQQAAVTDQAAEAAKALAESLDPKMFKTLFDFNRAKALTANYGEGAKPYIASALPSFDVGTNYVPHDMIAQIHEGEAITTAADNASIANTNKELLAEIKAFRSEQNSINASAARNIASIERKISKIDKNGVSISPVNGDGTPTVLTVKEVAEA